MTRSNRLKFFINIVEFCKGGSQSLHSLRRRLWAKERTSAREGHTKRCLLLVRPFFLVPTTSKRLLRRLSLQDVSLQNIKVDSLHHVRMALQLTFCITSF